MRVSSLFGVVAWVTTAALLLSPLSAAGKKKKKKDEEPVTQTLPVLKDPPAAVTAQTDRLSFHIAPLSGKGLLSAQVRDALKALLRDNRGTIVKLRAFVAGTGDMRRVGSIVSEVFTDKKLPLPALTVIQAGALPLEGAQVALEATLVEKKSINPQGVAFIEAASLNEVRATLESLQLTGGRVLQATCYLPSLDSYTEARSAVAAAFPAASVDMVQMQRLPVKGPMRCETVAALERSPESTAEVRGGGHAVLIGPAKVILSGTQMAFHAEEADVRLAFDRLGRTLDGMQSSYADVVVAWIYPLAEDVAEKVRARRGDYIGKSRPAVISTVLMEGLPSLDASFAVEVLALSH